MKVIRLCEVLSEVNMINAVFSLKFRGEDGMVHFRERLVRNSINVNSRGKMNRSGLLVVRDLANGDIRSVVIDCIVEFNGMRVKRVLY